VPLLLHNSVNSTIHDGVAVPRQLRPRHCCVSEEDVPHTRGTLFYDFLCKYTLWRMYKRATLEEELNRGGISFPLCVVPLNKNRDLNLPPQPAGPPVDGASTARSESKEEIRDSIEKRCTSPRRATDEPRSDRCLKKAAVLRSRST
jgi:hypothetical protein